MTNRLVKIFSVFFGREREDDNGATMGRSLQLEGRIKHSMWKTNSLSKILEQINPSLEIIQWLQKTINKTIT